jgi:hypothetical protein
MDLQNWKTQINNIYLSGSYILLLANAFSLRFSSKKYFHTAWSWVIQMADVTHVTTWMPVKFSKAYEKAIGKN